MEHFSTTCGVRKLIRRTDDKRVECVLGIKCVVDRFEVEFAETREFDVSPILLRAEDSVYL